MAVLLLSGGLDSATLLATEATHPPLCVSFDYGQRHQKELWSAYQIAHYYGAQYMRLKIDPLAFQGSALTGGSDVPHGHFEDPIQKATVVPNRNMVFLSVAASVAVRLGHKAVLFAAHAGDAAIYPDCRPEFVQAIDKAMNLACGVSVYAPFIAKTKRSIAKIAREYMVPIDMTWSCYEGCSAECGKCGACVERREALGE